MITHQKLKDVLYSELLVINTEHMIERYNRALLGLTGKATKLTSFHIDGSGFSPEIAEEFDDQNYLNPNGVNRQFILLDIKQESLPLFESFFTSTAHILKSFISDNRSALLTLTALDCVYGELENNIYKIEKIEDLLSVKEVEIKIETPKRLIEQAKLLNGKLEELRNAPSTTWLEDQPLEEIIDIAKETGNITLNKIIPEHMNYSKDWFYTDHFGGLYVFTSSKKNVIINMGDELNGWSHPDYKIIDGKDHKSVYKFLLSSKFIEKLKGQELRDQQESIKNKKFQVMLDHLSTSEGLHHQEIDWFTIKQFIFDNYNTLPPEFHELYKLSQQVEREEAIPTDSEMLFYVAKVNRKILSEHRSNIVNHMLANFTQLSYMRTFTYNRSLFIKQFNTWSSAKQNYIAEYLSSHLSYLNNLKH